MNIDFLVLNANFVSNCVLVESIWIEFSKLFTTNKMKFYEI